MNDFFVATGTFLWYLLRMEDLAKARYLVGAPGDQKFKRNIPKRLQALAQKTAFVERVTPGARPSEVRQQGNLFAVRTDAELHSLEAMLLRNGSKTGATDGISLTEMEARQVAVSYFIDRDEKNLLAGDYFANRDHPDFPDLLSDAADAAQMAQLQASGEYRTTTTRALRILADRGILSKAAYDGLATEKLSALKEHRAFQLLCRLIERADVALTERRYHSVNLGSLAPISDQMFAAADHLEVVSAKPTSALHRKTLADLNTLFHQTKADRVTQSRTAQYRIPFRALEEHFGAAFPVADIDRDGCRELIEFLPKIPSHVTQHYKKAKLAEAAELHKNKHGDYASRHKEADKHIQILRSAFDLALQERWIEINPWVGLKAPASGGQSKKHLAKASTYAPFAIEHLNALFALPLFKGCVDDEYGCHSVGPNIIKRHRYWAPILALWSGMRMNEILQLEKEDIRQSPDGIWFISVTDEEHGDYEGSSFSKRVKTKNAVRKIPLHPSLIKFGFVPWVEQAKAGRLFPEAIAGAGEKPSDAYSKRFRSNLKAAKIWEPRRLVFHSFRNSFNDALRGGGVEREIREAINGWREQKSMDDRYGSGPAMRRLADAVSKVEYSGLLVEHLHSS
ncbi:site-specific integrase [Aminobacter sp. NyZ550]|uniref:site-specific integrase n=1 Tax=Aminobacter sp. NyZ550 TaxID=2979870 RepID=UPI0021D5E069|nr:site-specific integrase [Aminobacter sp. NyZ550]WAX97321.1 site-specific integrase [Aminobacter sp. NyZ550]